MEGAGTTEGHKPVCEATRIQQTTLPDARRLGGRWQLHTSRARDGAAGMAMAVRGAPVRGAPVRGCGVVRVRVLSWTWRDPRLVYRGTSCGRALLAMPSYSSA